MYKGKKIDIYNEFFELDIELMNLYKLFANFYGVLLNLYGIF